MTNKTLSNFSTLTFDVYGTLIDWESGIIAGLKPLTDKVSMPLSRDVILQAHANYESQNQAYTPNKSYKKILAVVYRRLAELWGVSTSWDECAIYGETVKDWPAFDDSSASLDYLKKHYNLVVLSNIDNESFSHSNAKLGVDFDAVYTAEDIGSYKPAKRNFDYMIENLAQRNISKSQILHTAESHFHDHQPANHFTISNCWIYRRHDQKGYGATKHPGERPSYDFVFNSMAQLVEAHKAI